MLSVAKVDVNDYEQLRERFIRQYGTQTSKKLVITDFNNLKQKKDELVKDFFSRVGDIAYNYNVKKPNTEIMGNVPEVPEDEEEDNTAWLAIPQAQQRAAHEWSYKQIAANDISYLCLQFFVAGLHPNIQLEVIKSKTADLYAAFEMADKYETAIQNKERVSPTMVNELDATEDPEERAKIKAIRQNFREKRMFGANNGSAYQSRTSNGWSNGNNYSSGNGGASNSTLSGAQPKRNNLAFGKTCHYCIRKNISKRIVTNAKGKMEPW